MGQGLGIFALLLSGILYLAVLVIAAAIVGYAFEWGRGLYQRRHQDEN